MREGWGVMEVKKMSGLVAVAVRPAAAVVCVTVKQVADGCLRLSRLLCEVNADVGVFCSRSGDGDGETVVRVILCASIVRRRVFVALVLTVVQAEESCCRNCHTRSLHNERCGRTDGSSARPCLHVR